MQPQHQEALKFYEWMDKLITNQFHIVETLQSGKYSTFPETQELIPSAIKALHELLEIRQSY